jgi:ATP-binding cassette subfamily F protein uup
VPESALPESSPPAAKARPGSAEERAARKTLARLDKQLERVAEQEAALHAAIAEAGQDYERLADLSTQLDSLAAQRDELESEWLHAAELLE